ncbi:hypothetical protein U1Q18_004093 [Sarracenia purpurea var. burkii]
MIRSEQTYAGFKHHHLPWPQEITITITTTIIRRKTPLTPPHHATPPSSSSPCSALPLSFLPFLSSNHPRRKPLSPLNTREVSSSSARKPPKPTRKYGIDSAITLMGGGSSIQRLDPHGTITPVRRSTRVGTALPVTNPTLSISLSGDGSPTNVIFRNSILFGSSKATETPILVPYLSLCVCACGDN